MRSGSIPAGEPARVLAGVPLFAGLDRVALAKLAAHFEHVRFDAGETVFREGDPGDAFYEVHFACLLKEGDTVRVVHDRHRHALFTRQEWLDVLESTGFVVTTPLLDEAVHETQVAFVATRNP